MDECRKKIILDVLKNLKNPIQAVRIVLVGPELWFKPTKQIYQHVSKKNGASASGKKQQAGLTRQEASISNPFDALNMVEKDDDVGMNGGIQNGKLMLVDDDGKPLKRLITRLIRILIVKWTRCSM
uniref:Uncharacterized protein n=1 Tax=Tanacetum cinerariifolium TaxID=118510 RepID=A0A699HJV9_TANCI|nr:hypothetical protein [Tanacetum cinerariifolium]